MIPRFVEALTTEVKQVASCAPGGIQVHTIFIGGGTPSLLSVTQISQILETVRSAFSTVSSNMLEISMEANPTDLTEEYLSALREAGVNRLSLGMQSAVTAELDLFLRRHRNNDVIDSVSLARQAGFDNISLDLIYGVPYQTLDTWRYTLSQAIELQPDHISLYALTVEAGTSMAAWIDSERVPAVDDDLAADMYDLATDLLAEDGYFQYEISNWARDGKICVHNTQYWRHRPYLGFGPGAHGFFDDTRYEILRSPRQYIEQVMGSRTPHPFPLSAAVERADKVTLEERAGEYLMMNLRLTQEGVNRQDFAGVFGLDPLSAYPGLFERFEAQNLVKVSKCHIHLTPQGRLLSNVIFRELI